MVGEKWLVTKLGATLSRWETYICYFYLLLEICTFLILLFNMCRMTKLKNDGLKLNSCYKRLSCKKFWRNLCNIIVEKTYVNLCIPCNISFLLYPCTICFVVNETFTFEPKAKNTFPSFRTQRSMKLLLFLFAEALFLKPKHPPVLWWWWSYVCLNEWLWMQMYDVMCRANECPNACIRSHNHSLHSLGNDRSLFAIYFSASPLIFRCISADFSL